MRSKPPMKRSPYKLFTVSSVKTNNGELAEAIGTISKAACSGAATTPLATKTSVVTGAPVVKEYVEHSIGPAARVLRYGGRGFLDSRYSFRAARLHPLSLRLFLAVNWMRSRAASAVAKDARTASRSLVALVNSSPGFEPHVIPPSSS